MVSKSSQKPPYYHRVIDEQLDLFCNGLPAVAIEGARGVGKTATASQRARTIHDLDDSDQRDIIAAHPRLILDSRPPVLIDEWQRVPDTWNVVRRAVDDGAEPGRFLLTGSTSVRDLPIHSGAGRINSLRMRPMALCERLDESPTVSLADLLTGAEPEINGQTGLDLADYVDEILRSGFPGIRRLPAELRQIQLDSYLTQVVDRDLPELGVGSRNPMALRRWLTAYAAATSTTASFEKIRAAAESDAGDKPSRKATAPYRDALERLWLLDPVPGWKPTRNRIARLTEPPKHHLADPALAARLLGETRDSLLAGKSASGFPTIRDGSLLGAFFESLVTLSVRVYAQASGARVGHLRSYAGENEIDLIVERDDGKVVAIEVKLARNAQGGQVRNLHWLRSKLAENLLEAVVITTGSTAYRRPDGIAVVPAALLGP